MLELLGEHDLTLRESTLLAQQIRLSLARGKQFGRQRTNRRLPVGVVYARAQRGNPQPVFACCNAHESPSVSLVLHRSHAPLSCPRRGVGGGGRTGGRTIRIA